MVFNAGAMSTFLLVGSIVWLAILSVFTFRLIRHYNRLTQGTTKTGLKEILETVLYNQSTTKKQLSDLEKALNEVARDGKLHMQRLGVVRFNPFSDTGGSQSFTLAILDAAENGIVVTSLYARSGNRWYVKEIREGKGIDVELSKEEQNAIKKAHHRVAKPI